MSFALPAAFAVVLWWFATGLILLLLALPARTYRWSLIGASALACLALLGMRWSSTLATVGGAYLGFSCAIGVWGWLEIAFLTGWVTGSRKIAAAGQLAGWHRFAEAAQTVIHNEIATLIGGIAVTAATWHATNRVGLWTYLVLWGMRISAKLNLFLGVPSLPERFLPAHLLYLASYFHRRPMNGLYPFSVGLSSLLSVVLVRRFMAAEDAFQAAADALMASIAALGALEHYFMVLPLSSDRLWNWALREHPRRA